MDIEELKQKHDFIGKCGLKKSTIDVRDYSLTYQTTQVVIPDEFRLEFPDIVKDQGQTSMCASFSSSYIAEHLNKLTNNKYTELSPSFVYANRSNQDSEGMELRDAEKILVNTGICRNELFNKIETEPQLNVDYNNSNPDNLIKDAANYKTVSFAQISSVNDAKIALIQHGYLHIGVPWYQDNQLDYDIKLTDNNPYKKDGYISYLVKGNILEGCHALILIGFSKKYNGWWCFNTWGDYGNNGLFILPSDYPIDSCLAVIGKVGEPSNANTVISNITPIPVTPIISKKSDNAFLQTLWKIINYIINHIKK
jgi:hypothetical protein